MKQMPRADLAERNLLAAILIEPQLIITTIDKLKIEDFYNRKNAMIYEAMLALFDSESEINPVTVSEYLTSSKYDDGADFEYLFSLSELLPSTESFESYIELILDASVKRSVIKTASNIAERGYNDMIPASDYLDEAEEAIFNLSRYRKTTDFEQVDTLARSYYEKAEKNYKKGDKITGIDTGYSKLNYATAGFQPEELIIIAARPAMGKSAFAINLALNMGKLKEHGGSNHVAIFSLEMSNEQIVGRMLSNLTSIDGMRLRTGNLNDSDWGSLDFGVKSLSTYQIYFDDSAASDVANVRAKCRKLKKDDKLDIVIIDYLQLLRADKNSKYGNRQEEVSKISRSLKQMARELKVPVVALSQLSRQVEHRDDKRPNLADLRESGSIEQDADIVMFLYRPDYYLKGEEKQKQATGEVELIIAKNRQGLATTINFRFQPEINRFSLRTEREDES